MTSADQFLCSEIINLYAFSTEFSLALFSVDITGRHIGSVGLDPTNLAQDGVQRTVFFVIPEVTYLEQLSNHQCAITAARSCRAGRMVTGDLGSDADTQVLRYLQQ